MDVLHEDKWLTKAEADEIEQRILRECRFHRVFYTSKRFQKPCETPCWTNCYSSVEHKAPCQAMPLVIDELRRRLEAKLERPFNVALLRLYFGQDEIAWHTDARAFLGSPTSVASVSFGETRTFELKRVVELWPSVAPAPSPADAATKKRKNDSSAELHRFSLHHGSLLVMQGRTQEFYHHRVPAEPSLRSLVNFRININFRYVLPNHIVDGMTSYYRYCVCGDEFPTIPVALTFDEVKRKAAAKTSDDAVAKTASITSFFAPKKSKK